MDKSKVYTIGQACKKIGRPPAQVWNIIHYFRVPYDRTAEGHVVVNKQYFDYIVQKLKPFLQKVDEEIYEEEISKTGPEGEPKEEQVKEENEQPVEEAKEESKAEAEAEKVEKTKEKKGKQGGGKSGKKSSSSKKKTARGKTNKGSGSTGKKAKN